MASEVTGPTSLIRGDSPVLPWFLPGVAISAVLSLVVGSRVGRALEAPRVVASILIFSLGIIVSATLTPLGGRLDFETVAPGSCDLSRIGLAPFSELLRVGDTSLNVLLFIPLGVSIAFLPRSARTVAVILGAIAMPFAIEATQLLVTPLDRGCQSADVVDNLTGLVLGLAICALARWGHDRWIRDRQLGSTSRS